MKVPSCTCSKCGAKLNQATSTTELFAAPKCGDISICFYCGNVGIYQQDLSVETMNEEQAAYVRDRLPKVYAAIVSTQKEIIAKNERHKKQNQTT